MRDSRQVFAQFYVPNDNAKVQKLSIDSDHYNSLDSNADINMVNLPVAAATCASIQESKLAPLTDFSGARNVESLGDTLISLKKPLKSHAQKYSRM